MCNNLNQRDRYCAFIGIDWADKKHDICSQENGADEIEHRVIQHDPKELNQWLQELGERFKYQPIAVAIETSKGPLINMLVQYPFLTLFQVNPLSLSQYRKSFRVSSAKDDINDSELLCDMLSKHIERLSVIQIDDEQTRELRILSEQRRNIVEQRVRLTNQLKANLKQYFPLALEIGGEELHSKLTCQLLLQFPTFEELQKASNQALRSFYKKQHCRRQDLIDRRIKKIRAACPLTCDKVLTETMAMATKLYAKMLLEIDLAVKDHEKTIASKLSEHPDSHIFTSFPGAGNVFAARLLTVFGSDREKFISAADVQTISGVAPISQKSGNMHIVQFRHACPKFMRQSFVEFAGKSIVYSLWAKAFYKMQIDKGKSFQMALRALAFRWIRIMTKCWKDNKPYDELTYLKALQKKKSPLLKYMIDAT